MHKLKLLTGLRLVRVGLHLLYGSLQTAILFPFADNALRDRLKQRWSRQLLRLLQIELAPPGAGVVEIRSGLLVANHVSFVDIFAINALLPCGFVAKSDVADWPLIGWLSRRNDTVFIERGKPKAAHLTRQRMLEVLATGRRLAVFPEGTTTTGERVLPFHGALFQGAIDSASPVHCIVIEYVDSGGLRTDAPAYIGDLSLLECLRNIIESGGIVARITLAASFLPPLPDRRHLAHRAHQAVANALRGEGSDAPPQPPGNAPAISA